MHTVIRHLRRAALFQNGQDLTDGQLLEAFVIQRDQAAFEALVRRHGSMVLGVCRRALRNTQDAEDAFQATFLVLVRKAASIRPYEMVGHWLYGVAYRTALAARATNARRRVREKHMPARTWINAPSPEEGWHELVSFIDHELNRLPPVYQVPIVLCDLEGKTRKEAARQIGCPEGTLSSRLARGRQLLARRLSRSGFTLSGASLALALSETAASAQLLPTLMHATVKAATLFAAGDAASVAISVKVAALTQGVLKTMLLTRLKILSAVLLGIAIVAAGAGTLTHRAPAADVPKHDSVAALEKELAAAKLDLKQTQERVLSLERKLQKARQVRAKGTVEAILERLDPGRNVVTINLVGSADHLAKDLGWGTAMGDLDNDGDLDLFVVNLGGQLLKLNQGDGRFEDMLVGISSARLRGVRLENLPVAKDVKIMVNGKPCKLQDLKLGMRATLRLDVCGGITVVEVMVAK
jgi:RNA polymerase sigma factor (sigma-70 family)